MGLYSYSTKTADEKRTARGQVHDVNASYKDLSQVLAAIRHKTAPQAMAILEDAISEKKAIRYKKFAARLGHRSELGGRKGRYPVKEARIARELLINAVANAEAKGLDKEKLVVKSAASHKQNVFMRHRKYWASGIVIGYGRQSYASKYVTCWAEITLVEKEKRAPKVTGAKTTSASSEAQKTKLEAKEAIN